MQISRPDCGHMNGGGSICRDSSNGSCLCTWATPAHSAFSGATRLESFFFFFSFFLPLFCCMWQSKRRAGWGRARLRFLAAGPDRSIVRNEPGASFQYISYRILSGGLSHPSVPRDLVVAQCHSIAASCQLPAAIPVFRGDVVGNKLASLGHRLIGMPADGRADLNIDSFLTSSTLFHDFSGLRFGLFIIYLAFSN